MRYWFKPWTHWHEIKHGAYTLLQRAGYGHDMLLRSEEEPK